MVKILDCTLRDGGYVNNWNFSSECLLSTIMTDEKSGIDFIEIGYQMPDYIDSTSKNLVVMVDAKNIQPVDKRANFVRVACYPEQIKTAITATEDYKSQGFKVFLHLMTADKFENWKILSDWKNKNILESIYFADSYGTFLPFDVERIYKEIQDCGYEKISFHAHNNLQLAFANTIKAIELGAYSVDGSVYGIGRGAGNLPIELLLKYLDRDNFEYINLIKKYYLDIHRNYNWGYNLENLLGGLNNIHPSKVKALV